jgi:hypothetical protein
MLILKVDRVSPDHLRSRHNRNDLKGASGWLRERLHEGETIRRMEMDSQAANIFVLTHCTRGQDTSS